jgi:ATP-dependent RNA helicase RhlE
MTLPSDWGRIQTETVMNQSPTFAQLLRHPSLLKALDRKGYQNPTPIQAKAIPPVLAGHDLFGLAQTGTGKTAAFALPVLQRLAEATQGQSGNWDGFPPEGVVVSTSGTRPTRGMERSHRSSSSSRGGSGGSGQLPRCLVLTPTRELCVQVAESFQAYGHDLELRSAQIFGGVGEEPQKSALRRGVDIVIATPGRLLDLMQQGVARLERVEILILDEADRMLDMGFLPDMKRIISQVPKQRQTLLFSATMPREIEDIAAQWLKNPQRIEVAPVSSTPERIDQSVYFIEKAGKVALLRAVVEEQGAKKALVFSRTKHGADRICRMLEKHRMSAYAIHGNKSQGARQRALNSFRDGETRLLVATDLAARGIDVKGIDLVINYDLPNEPETYVHRIGRTARAGAQGVAISFCTREERAYLRAIERLTRVPIEVKGIPADLEQLAAGLMDNEPDDAGEERDDEEETSAASRPAHGRRPQSRRPAQGRSQAPVRDDSRSDSRSGQGSSERRENHAGRGGDAREARHDRSFAPEGQRGRRGTSRPNEPHSRENRNDPRPATPAGKPEIHHDHKKPLWQRLVNKFTGRTPEAEGQARGGVSHVSRGMYDRSNSQGGQGGRGGQGGNNGQGSRGSSQGSRGGYEGRSGGRSGGRSDGRSGGRSRPS